MTKDEALKLALAALEWSDNALLEGTPIQVNQQRAITAIKEALSSGATGAQPKKEFAPGYCKHCKKYSIDEPLPLQPLTDKLILGTWCEVGLKHFGSGEFVIAKEFARAIEAAHGIKE